MNAAPSVLLMLYALLASAVGGWYSAGRWILFESTAKDYSVLYPASWHRMKVADRVLEADRLSIINFPSAERVPGVVIKKFGALIEVSRAPKDVRSVGEWMHDYHMGDTIVDQRNITVRSRTADGCITVRRFVTRSEVGPGTYFIGTDYFCSTSQGIYRVSLTNWEGDPHQENLQNIAQEIVLSLRQRSARPAFRGTK